MNKTIYLTYKKNIPNKVINKWKKLNPEYKIDFSLDSDCINFLKENFNNDVSKIFMSIDLGMYKADLWRLCKLYVHGGVYADVDLVPFVSIDSLLESKANFTSILALDNTSIFQAFMIIKEKRSPLLLSFILSFLINKPYICLKNIWASFKISNIAPTYDMFNMIQYNVGKPYPNKIIEINNYVKIPIVIGRSNSCNKIIDLVYFPHNLTNYTIDLDSNNYNDKFNFKISNNKLIVTRIDKKIGWYHNHICIIKFKINKTLPLMLFQESGSYPNNYISYNNKLLFKSRDLQYHKNRGW